MPENSATLKVYVFQAFVADHMENQLLFTNSSVKNPFLGDFELESRTLTALKVVYDEAYFADDLPPQVSADGVVSFRVRPFVHGNTSVMLQKTEFFELANKSVTSAVKVQLVGA